MVADRQSVVDAHVQLLDEDRNVVARTTSGRHGRFGSRHVRPGRYVLAAFKRGVGSGHARVAVWRGQIARARIILTQ